MHDPFRIGRRGVLLGSAITAWGCSRGRAPATAEGPSCLLTPELEEGPYFLDDARLRGDIREGKPGVPLSLELTLIDVRTCQPIRDALVDLWHCDGGGVYSGFAAESARRGPPGGPRPFGDRPPGGPRPRHSPRDGFGAPGPPPRPGRSDALSFLRGIQLSDAAGEVRFTTIYPGWYQGRAVHIHMKVRTGGALLGQTDGGGHVVHTGQLFLPEDVSDRIFALPPYASHDDEPRVRQADDSIFQDVGRAGIVALAPVGGRAITAGYSAIATVGIAEKAPA
jgi:protocatechuate 3,4-dioxygenase beta subunit